MSELSELLERNHFRHRCSICRAVEAERDAAVVRADAAETRVRELREAVESAYCAVKPDGCDCGTDEPGTCALCLIEALREKGWVS